MIRYRIPAEYADAVRAALTCPDCPRYQAVGHPVYGHGTCPTCQDGLSFWWGITAELHPALVGFDYALHKPKPDRLPAVVQQMLEPCRTCDGTTIDPIYDYPPHRCRDCRDGRPLVELVTDCTTGCYPLGTGPCVMCAEYPSGPGGPHKNTGIVSLGVVTATELLPVEPNYSAERTYDLIVTALDGDPYLWRCGPNNDRRGQAWPITVAGLTERTTHAIHLTGVTS